MTPQKLYENFKRLCPLTNRSGEAQYKAKGPNRLEIRFPNRTGKFIFEYHDDKNWSFAYDG